MENNNVSEVISNIFGVSVKTVKENPKIIALTKEIKNYGVVIENLSEGDINRLLTYSLSVVRDWH